ncbi:hypothetical protein RR46_10734 [Papilio xuthus]|uniref:Uncharacterized protein n=1 Tax=Papilio xuthus TaxID=66420 RepID=A0A194PL64_PAPXU|nr:hypothetical protein RR46_10734 [Papilio xuthus]
MSGGEPTLTEPPVPLALARLQPRAGRVPRSARPHPRRPSLALASLQEAADETPRRYSDEAYIQDTDDDEAFYDPIQSKPSKPASNGRRASEATFAERYRKFNEFDGPPPEVPRRASLAVPVGDGFGHSDKGRRRSWAAKLQLERKKRRKSGGNDTDDEIDPPVYMRQKRPSWWNVFVPDNMLKHRYKLLQLIMMGKIEGKRRAGRRKKSWLRNIREWTGIRSAEELFPLALERTKYSKLAANLQD